MSSPGPNRLPVASLVADDAGSGPVVLLLHGQPGRARDWHRVQARLTDTCRVVIPDRLGYGRTGGGAAGFAANADACVALLDRLGVERAVVAGHSWAGAVALALAEHHRDRVAGLALVASVAPGEVPGRLDRLLSSRPLGEALTFVTFETSRRVLGARRVRDLLSRTLPVSGPFALAAMTDVLPGPGEWRSFAVEQRAYVADLGDLARGLADVVVPVEILAGTDDHVVPYAMAEMLAERLPHAALRAVQGGGHLLPYERPDEVAGAIRRVLTRAGLPGAAGVPETGRH